MGFIRYNYKKPKLLTSKIKTVTLNNINYKMPKLSPILNITLNKEVSPMVLIDKIKTPVHAAANF